MRHKPSIQAQKLIPFHLGISAVFGQHTVPRSQWNGMTLFMRCMDWSRFPQCRVGPRTGLAGYGEIHILRWRSIDPPSGLAILISWMERTYTSWAWTPKPLTSSGRTSDFPWAWFPFNQSLKMIQPQGTSCWASWLQVDRSRTRRLQPWSK